MKEIPEINLDLYEIKNEIILARQKLMNSARKLTCKENFQNELKQLNMIIDKLSNLEESISISEYEKKHRTKKDFLDCVFDYPPGSLSFFINKKEIAHKIINKLPDIRIADLSNILLVDIIDTDDVLYLIKFRNPVFNENGIIDVKKSYDKINESDFIEISSDDYKNIKDYREITMKTKELIKPGSNVIFTLKYDDKK